MNLLTVRSKGREREVNVLVLKMTLFANSFQLAGEYDDGNDDDDDDYRRHHHHHHHHLTAGSNCFASHMCAKLAGNFY